MKITVSYRDEEQEIEMEEDASVEEALREAGITPQDVIPRIDGTVVTDKDGLEEGAEIEAVRVISGG